MSRTGEVFKIINDNKIQWEHTQTFFNRSGYRQCCKQLYVLLKLLLKSWRFQKSSFACVSFQPCFALQFLCTDFKRLQSENRRWDEAAEISNCGRACSTHCGNLMCAGRVLKRTALQHKMQNFTYVNVFELCRYTTRFHRLFVSLCCPYKKVDHINM